MNFLHIQSKCLKEVLARFPENFSDAIAKQVARNIPSYKTSLRNHTSMAIPGVPKKPTSLQRNNLLLKGDILIN